MQVVPTLLEITSDIRIGPQTPSRFLGTSGWVCAIITATLRDATLHLPLTFFGPSMTFLEPSFALRKGSYFKETKPRLRDLLRAYGKPNAPALFDVLPF
jgi:hypothetical protein